MVQQLCASGLFQLCLGGANIYIPDAGWISFDPTNGAVGSHNLIPVSVGRSIQQVAPISGTFFGGPNSAYRMLVDVEVTAV